MALSDYLTSNEWDGCFYLLHGAHRAPDLGASMRKTIDVLLEKGYEFSGLDKEGNKVQQVDEGVNAPKLLIFLGDADAELLKSCLVNGRKFVQDHLPDLISETDEEWNEILSQFDNLTEGGSDEEN